MENEALELAMALGRADETERENLRVLCRAAVQAWTARLRPGVRAEDCGPALALAAAWTALAMLGEEEDVRRFSAGDLTIETGGGERGGRLRRQAEQIMAPYRKDDGFVFRGVRG